MDKCFIDALFANTDKKSEGRRNGMKTVLIVAGIIVFLVYGFVLYCCIRVGKESDEQYNKLREGKEQGDDRSRVCK